MRCRARGLENRTGREESLVPSIARTSTGSLPIWTKQLYRVSRGIRSGTENSDRCLKFHSQIQCLDSNSPSRFLIPRDTLFRRCISYITYTVVLAKSHHLILNSARIRA